MQEVTSKELREMIHHLSTQGFSNSIIAAQLGLSLSVVKKWRWRTSKGDFGTPRGRPSSGAMSSFPSSLADELRKLRKSHPGWGPGHLLLALQKMPQYADQQLPSIASITRFLSSEGLSRPYHRREGVKGLALSTATDVHQCWQMDAEGNTEIPWIGTVSMINIKDCYSRTHVMSYPAVVSSHHGHPNTDDYQTTLRAGFVQFGKPELLQVDHESIFYDNKSPSPFPTRLHLWLMALDIKLCYSRFHTPTDQAVVERTHQTIHKQAIEGQSFNTWEELVLYLDQRREVLNNEAPCSSLGGKAPWKVFPQARVPLRPFDISAEYHELKLQRIYQALERTKWRRYVSKGKTVSLGGQVYYLKYAIPKREITISFDLNRKKLAFKHDKEQKVEYKPIKDLSIQWLMGKDIKLCRWPEYQLFLPIEQKFQKYNYQLRLFE